MTEDEGQQSSFRDDSSDDEADWEEVTVPQTSTAHPADVSHDIEPYNPYGAAAEPSQTAVTGNIEITIQARTKADESARKKGLSYEERMLRIDIHKMHTVALLANGFVRNKWLNDELLHARLMSLTPLSIQNAFAMIHKSRVPDAAKRGRLFEAAIGRLTEWWADFFEVLPEGHLRSRTFDDVAIELQAAEERVRTKVEAEARRKKDRKGKGKQRRRDEEEDEEEEGEEVVRSAKSLMKHLLMCAGSRDVSAQLFTALCRALGVPARLVVSLQSVPWRASEGKPKASARKKKDEKGKERPTSREQNGEEEMEKVKIPAPAAALDIKGKGKAVFPGEGERMDGTTVTKLTSSPGSSNIKLRKQKPKGQILGSSLTPVPTQSLTPPDPLTTPPVFWTEVFSRPDGRWLPVDPIRCLVNKRKSFDPSPSSSSGRGVQPKTRVDNRMVYVVAFEEDGYARDVTPRYAKAYGAKVAKVQATDREKGGRGRRAWWESVVNIVKRPYQLQRDDVEDEELQVAQMTEAMPTSMGGFKDHPLYALARHLKRDEVIHPLTELGKFRGEPVYPRSNVLGLKSAESWMRAGRTVKEGAQPMKWVKVRAVTVNRKRELEAAGEAMGGEGEVMQGLYAMEHTEAYVPAPVVDGKIPKNDFGNIDLYVPSMLPAGAAHVPYKGTAKIARQLGFDYAEAVTGFEFRKRKANAVITGIVIAFEHESALLEAYWAAEQDTAEREAAKRRERSLKRWTRLVQGLRIRERLSTQYATRVPKEITIEVEVESKPNDGGGFLMVEDGVVQPHALPRFQYVQEQDVLSSSVVRPPGTNKQGEREVRSIADGGDTGTRNFPHLSLEVVGAEDEDVHMEEVPVTAIEPNGAPRTMAELAEEATRTQRKRVRAPSEDDAEEIEEIQRVPAAEPPTKVNGTARTTRSSTRTKINPTPPNGSATKAHSQPVRRVSRKRAREPDTEDEADEGSDAAVDEESELSDVPSIAPPPSKRPSRTAKRAAAAPVPAPAPVSGGGRTLRARRTKSTAEVAEERKREAAYRRAIAQ